MFNVPNTVQSEQQKAIEIPSPPSAPQQSKPMAPIKNEPNSIPLAPSQSAMKRARKIEPSDGNASITTLIDPRKKMKPTPQSSSSSSVSTLLAPPPPAPTFGKENQQPQLPPGQTSSSKGLQPQHDNNDLEAELTRFYESIRAATTGMPEPHDG